MKMNKHVWLVLIVMIGVLAVGSSLLLFRDKQPETIRLMLDWAPNTNHTGIYTALEKGWFEEEGIKLEIITPAGVSVESVVGAGKAHFGISFQEYVTSARIEKVPIISVAAVIQHNTSGFASLRSRSIASAGSFHGKRYGGWGLPIEQAIIAAMMERDGKDPNGVTYVNIGEGDLLGMLGRDIDFAWIFYGWQGIEAKLRGLDLQIVMMSDYFDAVPDYYTPVIITSEEMRKKHPEQIRRFLAAVARGYEYAAQHPGEAAGYLLVHAPELSPELVRASQEWLSPRYAEGARQWGYQDPSVWKRFGEWMYQNGLIAGAFDYEAAFTNEFLPMR